MRYFTLAIVLLVAPGIATATVDFRIDNPDNSGELTGYVTNDFVLTTTTDWLSATLIVTPTVSGQIYQDTFGAYGSPSSAAIALVPTLEWDTFFSDGLAIDGDMPSLFESPSSPAIIDSNEIDATYYLTAANNIGELTLARVTLADGAQGTWRFVAWTVEGGPEIPSVDVSGNIANGFVPEPTTLLLLTLGGLSLLRRRRFECCADLE